MNKKIIGILSVVLIVSTNINLYSVSFGNPFGVMNPDRKMTKQELIKATRLMMSAEFEAVQNYMQVAESIDDILAKKVFTDIANEERVHAGEFLRLLNYLDPEENEFYKKGAAEVEEEIKKLEPKPEQPKIEEEITKTVPATKESEKKEPISSINVSVEAETVSIKTTEPEVIKPEITALETKTESKTTETAVPEIIEKKQEPVQEQINAKEIEEPMQNPVEEKKIQKPNTIEKINNTEQKPVDKVLIESEIEDIADPIEFNIIEEDERYFEVFITVCFRAVNISICIFAILIFYLPDFWWLVFPCLIIALILPFIVLICKRIINKYSIKEKVKKMISSIISYISE